MKKLVKIQFFVLLIGTVFAWSNFVLELFAWLNQEDCTTGCNASGELTNPFLTPCFYGALFFTIAFLLNLFMLLAARAKKAKTENQPPEPVQPQDTSVSQ